MRPSVGNKQIESPSQEIYQIFGVCFNAVRAVFLEIFGYIHIDRQTDIQKVSETLHFTQLFCDNSLCLSLFVTKNDIYEIGSNNRDFNNVMPCHTKIAKGDTFGTFSVLNKNHCILLH